MDVDENDLLYSNVFIPQPELDAEVSPGSNQEFKKFYKKEQSINEEKRLRDSLDRMSVRSMYLSEENDNSNLMATNKFIKTGEPSLKSTGGKSFGGEPLKRTTKEIITYVSIDSRDRGKIIYEKPSFFKIFLGKTFYNVKSIKLASMEFPNTNAVINTLNHHIYWRNKEDITLDIINAITKKYSEYSVQLRIGSYVSTSLQTEISSKLTTVKRKDKSGDYHYFLVSLDVDTDIVTFTSLILTQLSNNSLQTSINTGIIEVNAPNHGYTSGQNIYLVGAKTLAGIPSVTLNTKHTIIVVNENTFRFEINIKASETLQGGGNTLKTGKIAPFQFLFGERSNTIAQNIGYPLENSSDLINIYIKSITNLYQVVITTKDPHKLTQSYDYIGTTCTIFSSNTSPNIDGSKRITQILSSTSFLVKTDNKLVLESYNNGQVTIGSRTLDIQNTSNYSSNTILVTTFTDHNYTFADIGNSITLYNTQTTPDVNDTFTLFSLYETNSFVIPGSLPNGGESSTMILGGGGTIPRYKPLTTHTTIITNIIIGVNTTTLTCPNHKLQVGDYFKIQNVLTTPNITNISLTVYSTPDLNTIIINNFLNTYDNTTILNNTAYIGTGFFSLSFPNHGFNKITSIQNTTGIPNGQTAGNLLIIQTQLPHNFTSNDLIRITSTNTTPVIDGGYNITKISADTFTIPYSYPLISPGSYGIIGYNQNFYLYSSTDIGGIASTDINNKLFTIRDIIDENNFTFYNNNTYSTSSEIGGGNTLYISSLLHGFNGQQTNTKNNMLNRSINLQGENYAFLCCPQLSTMMNTGNVKDIFARITLDESPGTMVFSFLSNPKVFNSTPLNLLSELEFSILNHDGTEYEFNDLDYSFTLEITEVIDITEGFNLSSKRGIVDL
jgi:hypothetical protein